MRIELKLVAEQTPQEREGLRALSAAVYPPAIVADSPARQIRWASARWVAIVRDDDDRIVGYVGIHLRQARVDGRAVQVGGIGGVKTHPDARGQGTASAALGRAAAFMADELAADFGLLVCKEQLVPFYGKLGWRAFAGVLLVEQPGGTVPFTANLPMVLPLRGAAPLSGTIDLCGLPW